MILEDGRVLRGCGLLITALLLPGEIPLLLPIVPSGMPCYLKQYLQLKCERVTREGGHAQTNAVLAC